MPSINMIAEERSRKRRRQEQLRRMIYFVAAEAGFALVVVSIMVGRLVATGGNISDLQSKLAKLQPVVSQIQTMQKETQAMQPIVTTLDGAREDTLFWYNGIYAAATALPEQSWLTTLSTVGGSDGAAPGTVAAGTPQLNMSGIALSQDQVGDTILRMNLLPQLNHVQLSNITRQKTGDTNTVAYTMSIFLTPEPAPAGTAVQGAPAHA